MSSWLRSPVGRHARVICAAGIAMGLWAATRLADRTTLEASSEITRRFQFTRTTLPEIPGPEPWSIRKYVHPSLSRVPVFVSGIGSGVAVNDLDGDGLSNDVCLVESRTDQAIVEPAPGTGERYAPFALPLGDGFVRDRMAIMGCMPGDFNEDGRMDILLAFAGKTPVLLLRREGSTLGPAAFRVQPLVEPDQVWITGPVGSADYDGDGHVDLLVANYFKDGSDIYNAQGTGRVEMPHSQSRAYNGGGQRFYRWTAATAGPEPSVSFVEETEALPRDMPKGWSLATASYDLDGDMLPEVYIAHDFGPDRLLHNVSRPGHIRFRVVEGEQGFATPLSKVLGHDSFKSMGVDFGDMNGDGLADIYVSNMTSPRAGYESQEAFINTGDTAAFARGKAPFVDRAESLGIARTGWAWEARLADFDNDGVLEALQTVGFVQGTVNRWPELQELALANDVVSDNVRLAWPTMVAGDDVSGHQQNPFFVRQGDRYVNVAAAIGFKEDHTSRGIALADANGDGGLDIVVSNMWGPSTYYENRCGGCGQFLGLHIVRPSAGAGEGTGVVVRDGHPRSGDRLRPAVGTMVRAVRADGKVLLGHVDGGGGHTGKRSPDVLLGLGPQGGESEVRLQFRLPGGAVRTETLRLKPGWHTVILGAPSEGGSL
jgi:enediyne biosynthesis protein E4